MAKHFAIAQQIFLEEISALQSALSGIQPTFDAVVEFILQSTGKLVVTGLGKSGLVGHKIAATLASTGTPALFINAAEALHGDLGFVSPGDIVLMVSNSGNTTELIKMLPSLDRLGAPVIGLFGQIATPLSHRCRWLLHAKILKEACPLNLAPMSSSTVAMVIGDALAAALMTARGFKEEDFALRHPGGILGKKLLLKVEDFMRQGPELPMVSPETPFREVIVESTRPNLGAVCVTSPDRQLLGIITDGDIRRFLLKTNSLQGSAKDLMTPSPRTASVGHSIQMVLSLMETKKVYVLPVLDSSQRLVGIIRMHDILQSQ